MKHLDEGQLQAWLDRPRSGLGPREAGEIERHLRECEECARRLEELRDLADRADSILSTVEPADARVPPFGEVEARSGRGGGARRGRRGLVALAWAASLVGAIGVGWLTNELQRGGRVAVESGPPEPAAVEAPSGAPADAPSRAADTAGDDPQVAEAADTAEPPAAAAAERRARTDQAAPAPATIAPTTFAEPRVVRGRVTDEEGQPLASAQVVAGDGEAGSLTEEDGSFSLELSEALASADSGVSVTAEQIGYAAATRRIAPEEGDTVATEFRLRERAVALDEMTVEAAPSAQAARAYREARQAEGASGGWRSLSRELAEAWAGFAVLTVPGLEVLAVEVGELEGAPAVRVRQAVGPETVLTLVQRRAQGATPAVDQPDGVATASTRRGELLITGTAPMPADSLRGLLSRIR